MLASYERIVIKIGSALLINTEQQCLRQEWLNALAQDMITLHQQGKDILIVTSGAVAAGRFTGKLKHNDSGLQVKQAAAALGQAPLMQAYQHAFGDQPLAQILLTPEDTENRRQYLNARQTIETLLDMRVIPVINENDTTATAELRFGDNDQLAARVAQMSSADCLVLLSDIDGLYTANPKTHPEAKHIPVVEALTSDILGMADHPLPGVSTGGMITKLKAADIAIHAGCTMMITNGQAHHALQHLNSGHQRHTRFMPTTTPTSARKQWIGATLQEKGALYIDEGATQALTQGRSLLPIGITHITGQFNRGDAVIVYAQNGKHRLGKGLVAYPSDDLIRIIGHHSHDIPTLLGYDGRPEAMHRNDFILME